MSSTRSSALLSAEVVKAVRVAAEVVGTTFVTESTGGGWLCLVARLEGGVVLVLSDGLGAVEFARGYLAAGVYRSEAEWQDSGYELLSYVDTTRPDDAAEVRRVVLDALAGATDAAARAPARLRRDTALR